MIEQPLKKCPSCGQVTQINTPVCQMCGHQYRTQFAPTPQPTQMFTPPPSMPQQPPYQPPYPPFDHLGKINVPPRSHSIVAAIILSLVILPGAGQIYNHQIVKGVLMIVVAIASVLSVGYYAGVIWLVALADAGAIASRLCKGEPVDAFQWF